VLADLGMGKPQLILMASGTEVSLIVEAGAKLAQAGINVRLVSFPCWELFDAQGQAYQESVLLPEVRKRISIEAGVSQGWERWVGEQGSSLSIERFGASAPYKTIYEKFGLTTEAIVARATFLLKK
jgi:transketolase